MCITDAHFAILPTGGLAYCRHIEENIFATQNVPNAA